MAVATRGNTVFLLVLTVVAVQNSWNTTCSYAVGVWQKNLWSNYVLVFFKFDKDFFFPQYVKEYLLKCQSVICWFTFPFRSLSGCLHHKTSSISKFNPSLTTEYGCIYFYFFTLFCMIHFGRFKEENNHFSSSSLVLVWWKDLQNSYIQKY